MWQLDTASTSSYQNTGALAPLACSVAIQVKEIGSMTVVELQAPQQVLNLQALQNIGN